MASPRPAQRVARLAAKTLGLAARRGQIHRQLLGLPAGPAEQPPQRHRSGQRQRHHATLRQQVGQVGLRPVVSGNVGADEQRDQRKQHGRRRRGPGTHIRRIPPAQVPELHALIVRRTSVR
jgi:hypothetical protein